MFVVNRSPPWNLMPPWRRFFRWNVKKIIHCRSCENNRGPPQHERRNIVVICSDGVLIISSYSFVVAQYQRQANISLRCWYGATTMILRPSTTWTRRQPGVEFDCPWTFECKFLRYMKIFNNLKNVLHRSKHRVFGMGAYWKING